VGSSAEILAEVNARAAIAGVAFTDIAAGATAAQVRWYAVYTCANHEKRVADQFASRGVEHFLPQYESMRRWKDRKVRLHLPLFPGYLFVHLAAQERLRVLQVPGVVRLVGFNGLATPLPDAEMETLRSGLSERMRTKPHPFLSVGRRVRITGGPFAGLEGILKRRKSCLRVIVSLQLIRQSVALEVDAAELAAI
jgi:transcription antitermination factor NusG